tara:strand:- start:332 stop:685 length:354 start_codon:yes stop_codon:yes gene_type:complete
MPYKDSNAHKEAKARWYQKNKQLTKDRALGSKKRTQDWFKKMKFADIQCGCSICGLKTNNSDDYDYHHRDSSTKITSLADMVGRGSRQAILDEAKKCDIVCKSCHSNIHKPNYPFHK